MDRRQQLMMVGSSWSPLTPGVPLLWLDASVGITASGGSVSSWTSRSNGYSLLQTTANKPVYSSIGWGGFAPGVTFASGDYLFSSGAAERALNNPFSAALNFTLLARLNTTGSAAYRSVLSWTDEPASYQFLTYSLDPSDHNGMSFSLGSNIPGTVSSAGKRSLAWRCDNTTANLWVDGASAYSGAFSGSLSTTRILLGLDGLFSAAPYIGTMAEIVLYSSAISDAHIQSWQAYARRRWP